MVRLLTLFPIHFIKMTNEIIKIIKTAIGTNVRLLFDDWIKSKREVKMEGIRRLEDLITTNSDVVIGDIHVVVLALLVEVYIQ